MAVKRLYDAPTLRPSARVSAAIVKPVAKKPSTENSAMKKVGAIVGAPFGLIPAALGAILGSKMPVAKSPPITFPTNSGEGLFYDKIGQGAPSAPTIDPLDAIRQALGLSSSKSSKKGPPVSFHLPGVHYGQTSDDLARAKDLINLEYGAKESAIERAMKQQKVSYNQLLSDLNEAMTKESTQQREYGKIGDTKLADLYSALGGDLQKNAQAVQNIYGQGQQSIKSAYDTAAASQASGAQNVNAGISQLAQQLGVGAALPENIAKLQGEQANTQARTAEAGAGAQANIATNAANQAAVAQTAVGSAAREGAQQRAALAMSVTDALAQINVKGMQGKRDLTRQLQSALTDLTGQLAQMRGEEGTALREAVRQVTTARTQDERQRRLDSLNEQLQQAQLNMQQEAQSQKFIQDKAQNYLLPYQIYGSQLDLQKQLMELQALQSGQGSGVNPLDVAKLATSQGIFDPGSANDILTFLQQLQGGGAATKQDQLRKLFGSAPAGSQYGVLNPAPLPKLRIP